MLKKISSFLLFLLVFSSFSTGLFFLNGGKFDFFQKRNDDVKYNVYIPFEDELKETDFMIQKAYEMLKEESEDYPLSFRPFLRCKDFPNPYPTISMIDRTKVFNWKEFYMKNDESLSCMDIYYRFSLFLLYLTKTHPYSISNHMSEDPIVNAHMRKVTNFAVKARTCLRRRDKVVETMIFEFISKGHSYFKDVPSVDVENYALLTAVQTLYSYYFMNEENRNERVLRCLIESFNENI